MEPEFSVLVVDDNESIREVLAIVLSGSGYRCESAKNGVEAMQRVRQARFDAVVAYSDAFRPPIPIQVGHPFRFIPAGHSDPFRPPPEG